MGLQFLRLRISEGHNKIKAFNKDIDSLLKYLTDKVRDKDLKSLLNVVSHNCSKVEKSLQAIHQKKHERLCSRAGPKLGSFVNKDRWVINFSDRQLNQQERQVLQRGLNFSITPRNIPVARILSSVESGIYDLEESKKQEIRFSITNILKSAKPPHKRNINAEEEKYLKGLKKDESIVILPADKGNAVVIMNRQEYNRKIKDMLDDNKTYRKITDKRRNPTSQTEKEMNKLLMDMSLQTSPYDQKRKQINSPIYRYLHSTDATSANFYGLPKIHKPNVPLRPITNCIGSPTYNLSKHLVTLLSPLLNNTHTVKNSIEFTDKIRTKTIDSDEIMVSFDVISLFTSIPVELALKVVEERLILDTTLSSRTNLSAENILLLLRFVLNHCFFQFDIGYYQQIFGCPMGSPVSALLANLVMEHIEEVALNTASDPPKWWYRYVDDSHCCLKKDRVLEFHQYLNSINRHIQFTYEEESPESGLAFLDTKTTRTEDGNIDTTVYRKPTHTERYLDFNSHHPVAHKRSVATTLFRRAVNVPSSTQEKKAELKHVRDVLIQNNYPGHFIRECAKSSATTTSSEDNLSTESNLLGNDQNKVIVLPYISGVSEKISKKLKPHGIKIAHKPMSKVKELFPRPKAPKDATTKTGVVYKIKCAECNFIYYGQTERSLRTRIQEHRRAICNNHKSSKIAQHANEVGHDFDFETVQVIERESNWHQRLFLEAWHSELDNNSGNDHIQIPNIYKTLVNSRIARANN